MNKYQLLSHIGLFLVALIYGANYVIAKDLMSSGLISPFSFILCRCIAGVLLFWITGALFFREKIAKKDLPSLILAGALGVAINQLCFFAGLAITSPIHGSLIMVMTPILILLASFLFLGELITKLKITGIALGFIGTLLLILQGGKQGNISSIEGDLLIFVNATSYACYLILIKSLIKKYHPITIVRWAYTFGIMMVIPFGAKGMEQIQWHVFSYNNWLAFFYVLIFTTFIAYLLNALSLKHLKPTTVGAYIYLQPLIATSIAIILEADTLDFIKISAGILIFAGVFMVSRQAIR